MKGIYPREPKSRKKVNKGSTAHRTYYYIKDIQYIAHEPVLNKFRELKVFLRKLKRAIGRDEISDAERLEANKPSYTLDHIVKERYLFLFITLMVHRVIEWNKYIMIYESNFIHR